MYICEYIYLPTYIKLEDMEKICLPMYLLGLGRVTFFMVRVGFRAYSFGAGWARAIAIVLRVDFGLEYPKYIKFGLISG